jgi:hypothetical protein
MRDLEDEQLFSAVRKFAVGMRAYREALRQSEQRYYIQQKDRWFLDAASLYCKAVTTLVGDLEPLKFRSRGFRSFAVYLKAYAESAPFMHLKDEAESLTGKLSQIRYGIHIRGGTVDVYPAAVAQDYGAEIRGTFERFQQANAKDYGHSFSDSPEMDHVEARVLEGVAQLHQGVLGAIAQFHASNKDFADLRLVNFDRQVQFYLGYIERMTTLEGLGLNFCYPTVSDSDKEILGHEAFDLALADKLSRSGTAAVSNDFQLQGNERVIVVSGPNQGGKTTFARMFGQLHYLAALGYPLPGKESKLFLPDMIFTHFEREEHMADLRGKLEDDLIRIHEILEAATPSSVIVINEIFASTSLQDAIELSKKVADQIMDLDALCVWVTFIDEVAALGRKTISMVSTVVPENPAERTFKIVLRPADGLAYAMSIAEKYRLTPDRIRERMKHESPSAL